MKTLTVAIQKGGQGKTCLTCHLAFDAYERLKKRVLVIDLDTQCNTSFTLEAHASGVLARELFGDKAPEIRERLLQRRQQASNSDPSGTATLDLLSADLDLINIRKLPGMDAARRLYEGLRSLDDLYDICLIDTPPSLEEVMLAAGFASDYIVSPVELETYSMMGLKTMMSMITRVRKLKPDLTFLGVLPNMVDGRLPRHLENLNSLRKSKSLGDYVIPLTIGLRSSISEALSNQQPVWNIRKTSARAATHEIHKVADHLFKKMGVA